jgi:N6-L-threonylcarbamoyladenine synthase
MRFSIPKISDGSLDFSFSGIKTAVLNLVKQNEGFKEDPLRADLLASFQESVANMLWSTTSKAISQLRPRSIMLSGGVAANSRLRGTDNAAMIAAAGTAKLMRGETAEIDVSPDPNLRLA